MQNEVKPKKKKIKLMPIFIIAFNIIAIGGMAIAEFGNSERPSKPIGELLSLLGTNWFFILLCFLSFLMIILCETLKYFFMLKSCTKRNMVRTAFEVGVLGKYYDFITPSGSGGQPFQMYYLNKSGLSAGVSGSLPVVGFLTNQLSFIIIAIVLFIMRLPYIETGIAGDLAAGIGIVCYAAVPMLMLLFSIFPKLATSIVSWIIKLGAKIKLVKDPEAKIKKVCDTFAEYRKNLAFMAKSKSIMALTFVFSAIAQLANAAVPYFVLVACGVENASAIDIITLSFYVYATVTYIPTPGCTGVAEGAFYLVFNQLSDGILFWGTLIWRFFTYYSFILLGMLTVAITTLRDKKAAKFKAQQANAELTTETPQN